MQNGKPSGSIGIDAEQDAIVLRYRTRRYGETEWQDIRQRVLCFSSRLQLEEDR